MSQYKELVQRLFNVNLFDGIKLGLNNILLLSKECDFPENDFKSIHVAGSNGKGSVSTKIAKGLELSGLKVGLYTSPHISCFRERIQINGQMISEDDVVNHLSKLFEIKDANKIPCTFFELTTMLAFSYFSISKVDVVVLETGLGGRLDATNIVKPILSIITSISLDHTEILGDTIEKIALEKAGIIKPYIPVIVGRRVPSIVKTIARENNSPFTQVKENFDHFDDENSSIAKKALEYLKVPGEIITEALNTKPPCRLETIQYHGKIFILDVAHNPDGLLHLFSSIKAKYKNVPLRVIFGLSQNKDIDSCLSILKNEGEYFHLVSAKNGRGLRVEELTKRFLTDKPVFSHETVADAINKSLEFNDITIICGTFFIMADARAALKKKEPRDEIDMNERTHYVKKVATVQIPLLRRGI
jgi:dihydrofolate synthase/folylpolyglutamate synthase